MIRIPAVDVFRDKIEALRPCIPTFLWVYGLLYLLALFLICFWVPANDWDSMTSYLARIKLEELGPLRETATLELQYTFPRFFDYLHKPLLKLGYFETLPNFSLLLIFLALLVFELPARTLAIALALVLGCQPILVQATMAKNDLAVGLLAFLAWYAIARLPNSRGYLAIIVLALCALIGTKWHGFPLAAPLGLYGAWMLATERRPTRASFLLAGALLPVYYYVSSAGTYIDNVLREGSLWPVPVWLVSDHTISRFPLNVAKFVTLHVVDTFDYVSYLIDRPLAGAVWPVLETVTFGAKTWRYGVAPSLDVSIYGAIMLVVVGCSAACLFQRKQDRAVRVLAGVAVFYWLVLQLTFPVASQYWRYYLGVYILGIVPAAQVLRDVRLPRWSHLVIGAYLLAASLSALLLTYEHRLVSFSVHRRDLGTTLHHPSIFEVGLDRDLLYFMVLSDRQDLFRFFRENIKTSDSLIVYNGDTRPLTPYLYPFIKSREPANTRMVNTRWGQSITPFLRDGYKFIACFAARVDDKDYELILERPDDRGIRIYRLRHAEAKPAARTALLERIRPNPEPRQEAPIRHAAN